MSRISRSRPQCFRAPFRRSLAEYGVPDDRDVLAFYIRWIRLRYYRADAQPALAPAAQRLPGAIAHNADPPSPLLDMTRIADDVYGVGAQFDGEPMRYPSEIDVVG